MNPQQGPVEGPAGKHWGCGEVGMNRRTVVLSFTILIFLRIRYLAADVACGEARRQRLESPPTQKGFEVIVLGIDDRNVDLEFARDAPGAVREQERTRGTLRRLIGIRREAR